MMTTEVTKLPQRNGVRYHYNSTRIYFYNAYIKNEFSFFDKLKSKLLNICLTYNFKLETVTFASYVCTSGHLRPFEIVTCRSSEVILCNDNN